MTRQRRAAVWLALLVGWAAIIFAMSDVPNPPGASGGEWRSIIGHLGEYGVFGALAVTWLLGATDWGRRQAGAAAWALAVLYGVSDEFHQSFVPRRDASIMDVGVDALGAMAGVAVALAVWDARRLRRQQV